MLQSDGNFLEPSAGEVEVSRPARRRILFLGSTLMQVRMELEVAYPVRWKVGVIVKY